MNEYVKSEKIYDLNVFIHECTLNKFKEVFTMMRTNEKRVKILVEVVKTTADEVLTGYCTDVLFTDADVMLMSLASINYNIDYTTLNEYKNQLKELIEKDKEFLSIETLKTIKTLIEKINSLLEILPQEEENKEELINNIFSMF